MSDNPLLPPLPAFPVDDFTLDQIEHALKTTVDGPVALPFNDIEGDTPRRLTGGEFTLSQYLDFLSGFDQAQLKRVGDVDGIPIFESATQIYSEHDVIQALITEIRRLRGVSGE